MDTVTRAVAYLRALARIDTSNPPGDETPAISWIASVLAAEGVPFTIVERAQGRQNLIAESAGESGETPLLLSSHVDVVPPGDDATWELPPFGGQERNGFLYGRGTLDMKYKSAFDLACLVQYHRATKRPHTLKVVFLADEECSGENGVRFVTRQHREKLQARYVINEVGGFNLPVGRKQILPIQVAEKGRCVLSVRCAGDPGHASTPLPTSSVIRAAECVRRLSAQPSYRLCATSRAFFEALVMRGDPQLAPLFQGLQQGVAPLESAPIDPMFAAQLRALVCTTIAPTLISGGIALNVIPSAMQVVCDVRTIPGTSTGELRATLDNLLSEPWYSYTLQEESPGYEISPSDPMVIRLGQELQEAWASELSNPVAVPLLMPATSDNTTYYQAGITPIGFAPIIFPEGFQGFALAHSPNERIPLAGFEQGIRAYNRSIEGVLFSR